VTEVAEFIKEFAPSLLNLCHFQDYDRSMFPLSLVPRDARWLEGLGFSDCWVQVLGVSWFRVLCSAFWIQGAGFRVSEFQGSGLKVQASGFWVLGAGCWFQSFRVSGFRFQGSGFWVQGGGFRVLGS
jgi:hypothetical protein